MELKDTVNMMLSDDYKQRFIAEYVQISIRRSKLAQVIEDARNGCCKFNLSSDVPIYFAQIAAMDTYMHILQKRAADENIKLPTRREIMRWT